MDDENFRQLLIALRSIEMEGRTKIDVVHLIGMNDLTEDQKKIIISEFGKDHGVIEHTSPVYFESDYSD